jgi:hypothetical protein
MGKFDIPHKSDYWKILSEYWIVKNVSVLKWNFKKPNYGIEDRVVRLFRQVGLINIPFRILLLNTSMVTHCYLPYGENSFLTLISVPFIRTLNLTQLEIALLVLEDYVRSTMHPIEQVIRKKIKQGYIGKNYYKVRKVDMTPFVRSFNTLDQVVLEHGFSFKQQFAITKKMKLLLSGEDKLQKSYVSLLTKIVNLVGRDPDYNQYVKFYPSPSIQLKWFLGKRSDH